MRVFTGKKMGQDGKRLVAAASFPQCIPRMNENENLRLPNLSTSLYQLLDILAALTGK